MKVFYEAVKENLYWLILALAFALLLWLAPKVNATERMVKNERNYSMSSLWSKSRLQNKSSSPRFCLSVSQWRDTSAFLFRPRNSGT